MFLTAESQDLDLHQGKLLKSLILVRVCVTWSIGF